MLCSRLSSVSAKHTPQLRDEEVSLQENAHTHKDACTCTEAEIVVYELQRLRACSIILSLRGCFKLLVFVRFFLPSFPSSM